MLSYHEKGRLAAEFNTAALPKHHPILSILKASASNTLSDYEMIRSSLSCMAWNESVLVYEDTWHNETEYYMARKDIWTFANVNLTAEDDKEIDIFVKARDNDVLGVLIELLASGYKTSFAWIDKQNSFVVTVSGTERSSLNKGTSMTAWSDSLNDAIMVLGYKVFIKTEGDDWLKYEQIGGRR